jgi:hypothetical protein
MKRAAEISASGAAKPVSLEFLSGADLGRQPLAGSGKLSEKILISQGAGSGFPRHTGRIFARLSMSRSH